MQLVRQRVRRAPKVPPGRRRFDWGQLTISASEQTQRGADEIKFALGRKPESPWLFAYVFVRLRTLNISLCVCVCVFSFADE